MACNCGSKSAPNGYIVTTQDQRTIEVQTLSEAAATATRTLGTFRAK